MVKKIQNELIACHDCDLLQREQPLSPGQKARCTRCGAVLYRSKRNSSDRALHLTLAGLILFVLANVYPFMTLQIGGRIQEASLMSGVLELWQRGMWGLSALVFVTSMAAPGVDQAITMGAR